MYCFGFCDIIGTNFAHLPVDMFADVVKSDEVSVLATQADWAWPLAVRDIFQPRGVNFLVADNTNDIVNVLRHRRIWTTIIDTDFRESGFWMLKLIRLECPYMPCLMLVSNPTEDVLDEAIRLDVFSVIDKPVDMRILKDQLNRLFVKKYDNFVFSQ
jgi:DNA-binding NtrC family response regulator